MKITGIHAKPRWQHLSTCVGAIFLPLLGQGSVALWRHFSARREEVGDDSDQFISQIDIIDFIDNDLYPAHQARNTITNK